MLAPVSPETNRGEGRPRSSRARAVPSPANGEPLLLPFREAMRGLLVRRRTLTVDVRCDSIPPPSAISMIIRQPAHVRYRLGRSAADAPDAWAEQIQARPVLDECGRRSDPHQGPGAVARAV